MPDGWCFLTGDPLARFKKANITLLGSEVAKSLKRDKQQFSFARDTLASANILSCLKWYYVLVKLALLLGWSYEYCCTY